MKRIRAIHPSATVFVGVLIALVLPFGQAVDSCSSDHADFTGVDLILYDVEPQPADSSFSPTINQSDREFADEVETNGGPAAGILLLSAVLGLILAVFYRGRLWATCCLVAALSTVAIAVLVNMDDAHIGWHLAFWLPAAGCALKTMGWIARLGEKRRLKGPSVQAR
jgi:hypothetical protein